MAVRAMADERTVALQTQGHSAGAAESRADPQPPLSVKGPHAKGCITWWGAQNTSTCASLQGR